MNEFIGNGINKLVLSNPYDKLYKYKKTVLNKIKDVYQIERFTGTQVFHENIKNITFFTEGNDIKYYKQANAWDDSYEYTLKNTDGSFYIISKTKHEGKLKTKEEHNRRKNYILPDNKAVPPLYDIGVMTKDGRIINKMYDKYKQINRFLEMLHDNLSDIPEGERVNVVDFGCGKSYLTFVTYYYLTEILKLRAFITGLDLKEQVIGDCNRIAEKYGYENLRFEKGDIADYSPSLPVNIMITLHACDTATDFALFNAVKWGVKYIFSVPCCQHEVNKQIDSKNLPLLTKYGIVKERVSALITDAVRGNMLAYSGYKVQLLEFVDLSHTPKNIMIRAVKSGISQKARQDALNEVIAMNEEFQIQPMIYKLLC